MGNAWHFCFEHDFVSAVVIFHLFFIRCTSICRGVQFLHCRRFLCLHLHFTFNVNLRYMYQFNIDLLWRGCCKSRRGDNYNNNNAGNSSAFLQIETAELVTSHFCTHPYKQACGLTDLNNV